MTQMGVGERLHREGMRHDCVYLSFGGKRDHVPLSELTGGKAIYVYGQNEVVKDLMQARLATGRPLHYEVSNVSVIGIDSTKPKIRYQHNGVDHELTCDFIAGCVWYSCGGASVFGVAGLYVLRARLCALQHALAEDHASISRFRPTRTFANGPMTPSGKRC
jgi:hypothetical protein